MLKCGMVNIKVSSCADVHYIKKNYLRYKQLEDCTNYLFMIRKRFINLIL